ncbi:MAG: 50S ribosomal protein L32 [Candidatus Sumerlaeia bacterium]|nr:50S ribosomal protein L32 [Candidatus Sumerlaeia bacterium]
MPVPRRRHCPSRQAKRRTHVRARVHQTVPCEQCGTPKLRHRVCPTCGTYKKVAYKERPGSAPAAG